MADLPASPVLPAQRSSPGPSERQQDEADFIAPRAFRRTPEAPEIGAGEKNVIRATPREAIVTCLTDTHRVRASCAAVRSA